MATREDILKLDESCISDPKFRNFRLDRRVPTQSNLRFCDLGFEMQDSSNFKISYTVRWITQVCCHTLRGGIKMACVLLLCGTTLLASASTIPAVLLPGTSPLVTFRILFMTSYVLEFQGMEV